MGRQRYLNGVVPARKAASFGGGMGEKLEIDRGRHRLSLLKPVEETCLAYAMRERR
jgi:hypothetical protein